jgi:hypothetical protein
VGYTIIIWVCVFPTSKNTSKISHHYYYSFSGLHIVETLPAENQCHTAHPRPFRSPFWVRFLRSSLSNSFRFRSSFVFCCSSLFVVWPLLLVLLLVLPLPT